MKQSKSDNMIGTLLHFLYFVFQINLYFLSLIIPIYVIKFFSQFNFLIFVFSFVIGFYIFLVCFMILISIFIYPLRKVVKQGKYPIFSEKGGGFIILALIYNMYLISPFTSFIQRTPFLYIPFYKMLGMKSKGFYQINNAMILDPWLLEIGNNVIFGAGSIVSAHTEEKGSFVVSKIKIGDNITLGGRSLVSPGCVLENNSVLGYESVLKCFTSVKESEVWVGIPAKKLEK